jgi:hypothetical protein
MSRRALCILYVEPEERNSEEECIERSVVFEGFVNNQV